MKLCIVCKKEFIERAVSHMTCSTECRTIHNKKRQIKWVNDLKNKENIFLKVKKCSRCKENLSIDKFNRQNSKIGSYSPHCRNCINSEKKFRYHHDEKYKRSSLNVKFKSNYGITLEQYENMFELQNGCCAICERHQSNFKKRLSVDHEHSSGKIRGLLCSFCNTSLGNFDDREDLLLKAIDYLKKFNNNKLFLIKGGSKS
jgi:hypothetical protein